MRLLSLVVAAQLSVGLSFGPTFVPSSRLSSRASLERPPAAVFAKEPAGAPLEQSSSDNNEKRVVMKFGGSSLANADRVDHVAGLIKDQILEGNRPAAVVCSAMGKTTNNLLNAGDFALEGRVNVDALRTLHLATIEEFGMSANLKDDIEALLDELEKMLNGVRLLQELSPRSLDMLVSFGERMSVRIVAARLNQIGVPAEAYDSWTIGMKTTSDFGDARILPEAQEVRPRRPKKSNVRPAV